MRKILLSLLFISVFTTSAFSQFDAQTSQYMFNHASFNPAAAGESGMIDITGQLRENWMKIPGAGLTTVINVNSPIKTENSLHGIGFNASSDEFGGFSSLAFHLQYAFKKKLGEGLLSLGTNIGFVSLGFSGDSVAKHPINIGNYHDMNSDPAIPLTAVVGNAFDLGLGAWYSYKDMYMGVSLSHLNQPRIEWTTTSELTQQSVLYFTSGYNMKLTNPKYEFKPSVLLKSDFTTFQFDLSTRLEYADKYWGGMAYRYQDAVIILAGINIAGGLSVGVAYDIPASRLITVSPGSLELAMVYSFEYVFSKNKSKYKSIRIL